MYYFKVAMIVQKAQAAIEWLYITAEFEEKIGKQITVDNSIKINVIKKSNSMTLISGFC